MRISPSAWGGPLFIVVLRASPAPASARVQVRFEDATVDSGLDFVHVNDASEEKYMVETMGSGGGFFDYDFDGDLDVYLVNGARVSSPGESTSTNKLYRNDGGGRFRDVTVAAGVAVTGYGMGMTAGDIDNGGNPDLCVTNFGDNVLYQERNFLFRNEGGGVLREVGADLGEAIVRENVARGAAPGDIDADGDLDVLVTRCGQRALLLRNEGAESLPSLSLQLVGKASNRDAIGARAWLAVGARRLNSGK
jgi:hypothetical protein